MEAIKNVHAGIPQPPRRDRAVRRPDAGIVEKVVDKFVMQLEGQLADRNVTIELTDEARKWLAKGLRRASFGARPLGA
jgi:hypothetical protein